MKNRIITQGSLFGLKGSIIYSFQEEELVYKFDDKTEKYTIIRKYDSIYGFDCYTETKISTLYYLLIGILFGFYGLITGDIFFILFSLTFFFLYYKSKEHYIRLGYDLIINKDSKFDEILNELKRRKKTILFSLNKESSRQYEIDKIDTLLKEKIIDKDEYSSILEEINEFYPDDFSKQGYYGVIKSLLKEKGISSSFTIHKYVFENKYLPGGFPSFSGEILLKDTSETYSFWFNWDKTMINPIDKTLGYYNLGDGGEIFENYGKSFFIKK